MRRAALTLLAAALVSGCGGSNRSAAKPAIVVSAASSLREALAGYARTFEPAAVRLSFAGSDQLAAQIRAGGRPDVFASANTKLPDALYAEGRVEKPVPFIANRLVLAVPSKSRITSLAAVERAGTRLAIGAASVPIGAYTRRVFARLPAIDRNRILTNVRTEEPDVTGIVGKLTQGAVDAGFTYATDVVGAKGALRAVQLPSGLPTTAVYEAAVVKGSKHRAQAIAFVDGLRSPRGQHALRRAGFLPLAGR